MSKQNQDILPLEEVKMELYDKLRQTYSGLPVEYDLKLLIKKLNLLTHQVASAVYEIGKILFVVNKIEGRERLVQIAKEKAGIGQSMAYNYMNAFQIAVQNDIKPEQIGSVGIYKILMMGNAPEEVIEEFKEKGTVDGRRLSVTTLKDFKEVIENFELAREQFESESARQKNIIDEKESETEILYAQMRDKDKEIARLRNALRNPQQELDDTHPAWKYHSRMIAEMNELAKVLENHPFKEGDERLSENLIRQLQTKTSNIVRLMKPVHLRTKMDEMWNEEDGKRHVQEIIADEERFDFSKADDKIFDD